MNRFELVEYFRRVREVSEAICKPLEPEDFVPQPMPDVSPPKWHLAHTSWFFDKLLLEPKVANYRPFHPEYDFLFNSYYKTFSQKFPRPHRGFLSRPTTKEIYVYRRHINEQMINLIETIDEGDWPNFRNMVVMGLNHEQQHQELLMTDIKYILAQSPLYPAYRSLSEQNTLQPTTPVSKASEFIDFEGKLYEIGTSGDQFFYDNEGPRHQVYVSDFKIQSRLVTNGEYLEFMKDGGYQTFEFWLSDGWDLLNKDEWKAPLYWVEKDGEWFEFTLNGLQPLDLDLPVCHVSFYEAEAYAQWANKRLLTEAEWEIAAQVSGVKSEGGNWYHSQNFHPTASPADSNGTPMQMLGNTWEWTQSSYLPYPGYKKAPGALGEYNGKFMIDQMVLRGGSCATSEDHIRSSYRNFFQPNIRWQFSGIRLAETVGKTTA